LSPGLLSSLRFDLLGLRRSIGPFRPRRAPGPTSSPLSGWPARPSPQGRPAGTSAQRLTARRQPLFPPELDTRRLFKIRAVPMRTAALPTDAALAGRAASPPPPPRAARRRAIGFDPTGVHEMGGRLTAELMAIDRAESSSWDVSRPGASRSIRVIRYPGLRREVSWSRSRSSPRTPSGWRRCARRRTTSSGWA